MRRELSVVGRGDVWWAVDPLYGEQQSFTTEAEASAFCEGFSAGFDEGIEDVRHYCDEQSA